MSSHVVVIAADLRRTTIKVAPGTYLTDVLQEACQKLKLPSDKYLLRHKQKQVDLSVPYRTSGLIPGAKLELVQKANTPSAIQVALQLPQPEAKEVPGGRLIQKFPSDLTLWKVLRQFESGKASGGRNINITARGVAQMSGAAGTGSGQLYYETPVLNIMGREFSTFTDFQKTLSQLGYNSGNVLIRLSYKTTTQTLYEAMEQIGQFFKEAEEVRTEPAEAPAGDKQPEPTPAEPSPDTAMTDLQPEPPEEPRPQDAPSASQEPGSSTAASETVANGDVPGEGDPYKPVNVFLAPSGTTPAAALAPVSETDFEPTAAHAQLHQARLQEYSKNKRLLSDKELEEKAAAEEAKIAAVKSVLVRVRFPDNTSSEWEVGPSETGGFLYEAVRHVMASPGQPFRLALPVGRTVIKDDSGPTHNLIKGYKLSGRVLVNLLWDDSVPADVRKRPFLKANIASQGQAVKVPDVPKDAGEDTNEPPPQQPKKDDKSGGGGGGGKKMPKWLKLGKK
ncbi:Tether containing UBX domain for-like protein [Hapsidospora chrysogenum ATCC 11550]|uniref:Tether containing UBX domain for-like protein n=1 Tax=Hapsidospora chrysogenum (strain ATCC 11550 / CBS 779.69 / DSM 880 / IAM 14645 / JCM 23072 / IMI 49137) TaxID=857340 RepID=A0A086T8X6_HAPC1|nr:Tether containing UBX domain for-like protein [Hapsidospora chrysogenum ATCC 11550]